MQIVLFQCLVALLSKQFIRSYHFLNRDIDSRCVDHVVQFWHLPGYYERHSSPSQMNQTTYPDSQQNASTDQIPKFYGSFDGSSSWYAFRRRFESFLESNNFEPGWDMHYLYNALKGPAANLVRKLQTAYKGTPPLVLTLDVLETHYETGDGAIHHLYQMEGEDHFQWADRVWEHTYHLYPLDPTSVIENQAVDLFISGLRDSRARNYLQCLNPMKFADAQESLQLFFSQESICTTKIPEINTHTRSRDVIIDESIAKMEKLLQTVLQSNEKLREENNLLNKNLAEIREQQMSFRAEFKQFSEDTWLFRDLLMKQHSTRLSQNNPQFSNYHGEDTEPGKYSNMVSLCFECEEPQHLETHCPAQNEKKTNHQPKEKGLV